MRTSERKLACWERGWHYLMRFRSYWHIKTHQGYDQTYESMPPAFFLANLTPPLHAKEEDLRFPEISWKNPKKEGPENLRKIPAPAWKKPNNTSNYRWLVVTGRKIGTVGGAKLKASSPQIWGLKVAFLKENLFSVLLLVSGELALKKSPKIFWWKKWKQVK